MRRIAACSARVRVGGQRFDGRGNITSISQPQYVNGSLTRTDIQRFGYDRIDRVSHAEVIAGAQGGTAMRTVDYVIDAYGNLKSRSRGATDPPLAGFEFDFTVDAATNRITADAEAAGLAWSYDLNGNAIRFKGQAGQQVSALWDARNRMTGFVEGDVTQGVPPAEWYAYDADGYRWLRMGKDGKAQLTVRDAQGTALADYIESSGSAGPQLVRHLIPALGRIIAERRPAGTPPTLTSSSTANSGSSFPLTVTGGYATPSYEVDISARSGFRNHLSGVTLDPQHGFLVPETALSPGETNMVRIRAAGAEPTGYSAPVALLYDPSVGPCSSNQVRALTASRSGTNIVIRWALGQANGKRFIVRFQREDTGATYLLTPTPLCREYAVAHPRRPVAQRALRGST